MLPIGDVGLRTMDALPPPQAQRVSFLANPMRAAGVRETCAHSMCAPQPRWRPAVWRTRVGRGADGIAACLQVGLQAAIQRAERVRARTSVRR
jgi:hypothetical protein